MSKDYEVGYCKPPKHTQFPPNQSGNPKGRPMGSKNFKTDVKNTLKEPVALTKDGKRKKVSTQQAALMRLREKALGGDARALDKLLDLARTYNDEELAKATATLSPPDAEILEAHSQRLLRREGLSQTDDNRGDNIGADPTMEAAEETTDPLEMEDDDDSWLC